VLLRVCVFVRVCVSACVLRGRACASPCLVYACVCFCVCVCVCVRACMCVGAHAQPVSCMSHARMAQHGAAWWCMALHGAAWRCMALQNAATPPPLFGLPVTRPAPLSAAAPSAWAPLMGTPGSGQTGRAGPHLAGSAAAAWWLVAKPRAKRLAGVVGPQLCPFCVSATAVCVSSGFKGSQMV
jgi:hypothetical protein